MELFDQDREVGMSQEHQGAMPAFERHRLSRWRIQKSIGSLKGRLTGPRQPPHRLLSEEEKAFQSMAAREKLTDACVPVLCAHVSDTDMVHLRPSTGYQLLKEVHLSEPLRMVRHHKATYLIKTEVVITNFDHFFLIFEIDSFRFAI